MPIYGYKCLKCGQRFELRRDIKGDDNNIKCPKCGTEKPQRVITGFVTVAYRGGCTTSSPT